VSEGVRSPERLRLSLRRENGAPAGGPGRQDVRAASGAASRRTGGSAGAGGWSRGGRLWKMEVVRGGAAAPVGVAVEYLLGRGLVGPMCRVGTWGGRSGGPVELVGLTE
jgi:hypothetical protein